MIRILRHVSVRFWITTLITIPLIFVLLPWTGALFPGLPVTLIVAIVYLAVGLGIGSALDIVGLRRIKSVLREGELWERSGIQARAEKKYIQAVRIYDSAWISPLVAKRTEPALTACLARFYLTSGSRCQEIQSAAAVYLSSNPGDETLAKLWLERIREQDLSATLTQSVLTALADMYYAHQDIAKVLVGIFLDLGRVDFSAKRLYRNFLDNIGEKDLSGKDEGGYRDRVNALIAAGEHVSEPNAQDSALGVEMLMERTLGDLRAAPVESYNQETTEIPIHKKNGLGVSKQYILQMGRIPVVGFKGLIGFLRSAFSGIGRGAAGGLLFILNQVGPVKSKLRNLIRDKERIGVWLKGGLVGFLGIWLAFFIWNTLSHMLKSTEQPAHKIEVMINKPFTIQVAAYLKQAHADRYVAALKKKGITATVKSTGGGGKTWYLVRVSEFTDKKSAAEYGNRLKSDKVIDDFFVSNK